MALLWIADHELDQRVRRARSRLRYLLEHPSTNHPAYVAALERRSAELGRLRTEQRDRLRDRLDGAR